MNWAEPLNTIAAPLMIDNIDTDQIIPSREMKTISKKGLKSGFSQTGNISIQREKRLDSTMTLFLIRTNSGIQKSLLAGKILVADHPENTLCGR